MDTHTLVVMNVLLYLLYAGVVVVNARMVGTTKGTMWFAGSNLSRGVGLLVVLGGWLPVGRLPVGQAVGALLAVSGMMMLHLSFAELLDRRMLLRMLQYVLMGTMAAGTIYLLFVPSMYPAMLLLSWATESVQVAATASLVLLFSKGEEMGPAAWLTGVSLSLYAFFFLMLVAVTLRFNAPGYAGEVRDTTRLWMAGSLMTNVAITFGFLFLSTAKLRVELLWRAQADALTGLLNRWALTRIALREISRSGRTKMPLAVVMMDLDGLKRVNDALGHGGGDAVLQAVAGVLRETVREQDSVARMGGDEFCILLPDTGLAEAATVAERLRAQIDALDLQYHGQMVRVFASLGVASSEWCGLSWLNLVEQSDAALYQAKRGGRNRVVVSESVDALGDET